MAKTASDNFKFTIEICSVCIPKILADIAYARGLGEPGHGKGFNDGSVSQRGVKWMDAGPPKRS